MAGGKSGAFSITMKEGAKLYKRLEKIDKASQTAIKRTVSDFKSRAPGWIKQGVQQLYGVDASGIRSAGPKKKAGATHVHISGILVEDASLEYKGGMLTTKHFHQKGKSPKGYDKRNKRIIPGQFTSNGGPAVYAATPKPGTISVQVLNGSAKNLPPNAFIAQGKGGVSLPFQRAGSARKLLKVIKAISMPQMVSGDRAKETIDNIIAENLEKRLDNHFTTAMNSL